MKAILFALILFASSQASAQVILGTYRRDYRSEEINSSDGTRAASTPLKKPDKNKGSITVIAGALAFPFRYRPHNGDIKGVFESSFSLSLAAGPSWKLPNSETGFLHLLVGFGTSSISLTKKNTEPAANITDPVTRGAVTFTGSLVFVTQGVQFAFSIGSDMNMDNSEDHWIYQGNPWLSTGIGFNIFSSKQDN